GEPVQVDEIARDVQLAYVGIAIRQHLLPRHPSVEQQDAVAKRITAPDDRGVGGNVANLADQAADEALLVRADRMAAAHLEEVRFDQGAGSGSEARTRSRNGNRPPGGEVPYAVTVARASASAANACMARKRSASSAAMQPVPAAVTAWR